MPSTIAPLRAPVIRASTQPGVCRSTASAASPATSRERHEVALAAAVDVVHRRRWRGTTGARRSRSADQSAKRACADLARRRHHPALTPQEGQQRLAFEHGARAARRGRCSSRRRSAAPAATRRCAVSGSAGAVARGVTCIGSCCSVNQYDAYGPSVRKYGPVADARKLGQPEHLDRDQPGERRQIERRRLHVARQVGDDEDRFVIVAAQEGEDLAVARSRRTRASRGRTPGAAGAARSAASSSSAARTDSAPAPRR